ncbi:tripartite tricarboxylate transporter substrate binding protein [Falsiroseomonas oryzae]|uniref:tripartite tricarboxylate transporter substrate binding protein n=1 Tax=Falsiroseomonas oryzae TaxID=2766473 RepID=UPI0022EB4C97|nr:tripartite tricarboxylate transporter substrate binding protein [Roseomonas sp. MO-31]
MMIRIGRRAAGLLALSALPARAQDGFPTRPLSLIVPLPPGGTTDAISRAFAARMADNLRQPVVMDNRPGAGASVAYAHAARVTPDGYTLLMGINSLAVNPALRQDLTYAPMRDFAAVSLVARGAFVLAVHPDLPARSVAELVALAKASPGRLDQASTGVGSLNHLAGALFQRRAEVTFNHVPYRGGAQATADVLAGRVPVIFLAILEALPYVRDGRLRALAVTSPDRLAVLPDVPTIAESGLPGYAVEFWQGIFVPAATPPAVVARLNAAARAAASDTALVQDMAARGIAIAASSPDELRALLSRETGEWAELVRATGITAD